MPREAFRFFFPFRVRYSEIDGQGVVFNAHYLTYFDTAITEYFRSLGYDYLAEVKRTGADFHTVKTLVEYKQPIRFDQEIDVGVRVARIGNSSMTFELAILPKADGGVLATGEVVWVHTDQQTHKPVPVPPSLHDLIKTRETQLRA
jgi:acyl-CoA thioester hydrolase